MSRGTAIELCLALALAAALTCLASRAWGQDVPATSLEVEYEDDYVPAVPPSVGGAFACDTSGAAGQVDAGGVSISIPTYPCEVARTFQTIDELDEKGGFWRMFAKQALRARLVTRGIFSVVFGLFGLG